MLKRTLAEFKGDNLPDYAAALTYYGIMAIFPALVAAMSVVGLFGSSATKPLLDNLGSFAPGPARQILATSLAQLQQRQTAAGIALVVGIAIALWSASGYVAAFMRASNNVYDIGEGRPLWKKLPVRLGVTAALVILLTVTAIGVVITGDLAGRAGQLLGLGAFAVLVWDVVKWPVLIVLASVIFAILCWAAPNVKQPSFRWISPGSVLAVILWIIASALFGLYVANFGNYNKTYGSLAGVVIFLVWMWISNMAFLLGIEFNAEILRGRAMEAGHPEKDEPYVEPRDTRKLKP